MRTIRLGLCTRPFGRPRRNDSGGRLSASAITPIRLREFKRQCKRDKRQAAKKALQGDVNLLGNSFGLLDFWTFGLFEIIGVKVKREVKGGGQGWRSGGIEKVVHSSGDAWLLRMAGCARCTKNKSVELSAPSQAGTSRDPQRSKQCRGRSLVRGRRGGAA